MDRRPFPVIFPGEEAATAGASFFGELFVRTKWHTHGYSGSGFNEHHKQEEEHCGLHDKKADRGIGSPNSGCAT